MTQILMADCGPLISLAHLQLLQLPLVLGHHLMVPNAVFGLAVTGTLGVLALGRERGVLKELAPLIERLIAQGYWLSPLLISRLLAGYGETLSPTVLTQLEARRRTN